MKRFMISVALAAAAISTSTSINAADVGVSITVGQPGFYGTIDIGDFHRPPRVIYNEPIIVGHMDYNHHRPLYLHVPRRHMKHWSKYCHLYHACGRRVYFVDNDWYNREYVPYYQNRHRERHEERHDNRRQFGNQYNQRRDDSYYKNDKRDRRDYDDRKNRDDGRDKKDRREDRRDDRRD